MPAIRFRSIPHPQDVLAWQHLRFADTDAERARAATSRYLMPGGWFGSSILLAPDEPFPSFPSGVQYQGTSQAGSRPWEHVSENSFAWGPIPGTERTRHMLYEHTPGHDDSYSYMAIKTSTDYALSFDGKLYVLLPQRYDTPYDFSTGQWSSDDVTGAAKSPPSFPLSPYTQSYLCMLLHDIHLETTHHVADFFAVGKCTAGFTANFTTGSLGIWQSGTGDWAIDDVTAFGYSDAVAIEDATGVIGAYCPWEF